MSFRASLCPVIASLVLGTAAYGLPLGTNITVFDQSSSGTGWYGSQEDNETEPGTQTYQKWDLEGMFLNGTTLSIVGGFNFGTGVTQGMTYRSGDIFFDTTGDAKFGSTVPATGLGLVGSGPVSNVFGWDYVLRLNWVGTTGGTADLLKLDSASTFLRGTDIAASNPWRFNSGAVGGSLATLSFSSTSITGTGFAGDSTGDNNHYVLSVDTAGYLGNLSGDTVHFTLECGNDNIIGHVPDATSTFFCVASAFAGLVAFRRKYSARS